MDKTIDKILSRYHYIAVEGVIGAGKTTLATILSNRLLVRRLLEEFVENPFLEKFYEEPDAYAFQTQIYFLLLRFRQLSQIFKNNSSTELIIADYCFCKDRIFASVNLNPDDFELYDQIEKQISLKLNKPELVIFLRCSIETLLKHIKSRNRKMESDISAEYLQKLILAYDNYFSSVTDFPVLTVEWDRYDIRRDKHIINLIIDRLSEIETNEIL